MIEENVVVERPGVAMPQLKQKLNGYMSSYNHFYIGSTSEPVLRWEQHAPAGWQKMVVLYQAVDSSLAKKMERELIEYARSCNFMVSVENVGAGGEGLVGGRRPTYLYVLVG